MRSRPRSEAGSHWLGQLAESFFYPVVVHGRLQELASFYEQFAGLVRAGLPLYQAVNHLAGQPGLKRLRPALLACRGRIETGERLSEALAAYPHLFDEIQVEMIRAAEEGGPLAEMLQRLADYLEQELRLRRFLSRRTFYAKAVLVSGLFVIPSFFAFMMGAGLWDVLKSNGLTLLSLLGLGAIICGLYAFGCMTRFRSESAGDFYDSIRWNLPLLGSVTRKASLAKFGRTFAVLTAAGVPLYSALRVSFKAGGNRLLARCGDAVIRDLERGLPLSMAFRQTGRFPEVFLNHLHTGELSGEVDAMLHKAAEFLEAEAETRAFQFAYVFSELFFLLVALYLFRGVFSLGFATLTAPQDAQP